MRFIKKDIYNERTAFFFAPSIKIRSHMRVKNLIEKMESKKYKFDFTNEDIDELLDYCLPSVLKTFEDREIISKMQNCDFQVGIDFTQRGAITCFLFLGDVKFRFDLGFHFNKLTGKSRFTLWWDDEEVMFNIVDDAIIELIKSNVECIGDWD